MAGQFSGKVAIVTGSSSGLGEAIANMLAKKGANVTLCGRDSSKLESVLEHCSQVSERPKDSFLAVVGDITNGDVRREIIERTVEKFDRLDILVNNAGIAAKEGDVTDVGEREFDNIMNVNMKSPFFLSQAAVPYLEKSKGCIVNVSSMLSSMVANKTFAYPMSKAAVDHMTRGFAVALAPKGIRVNAVNPSWIPTTDMSRDVHIPGVEDIRTVISDREATKQPMNGVLCTADDVANFVCFLASPEAGFVTGQCHLLDGGRNFLGVF